MTEEPQKHRRLTFDPTINAGHILTFIGMGFALFVAWTNLDKRVVMLEERQSYQRLRDENQDTTVNQQAGDIKASLAELKAEVRSGFNELRRERKP